MTVCTVDDEVFKVLLVYVKEYYSEILPQLIDTFLKLQLQK